MTWQGLREEWVCHGREEVIQTFRWGLVDYRRRGEALAAAGVAEEAG